MQLFIILLFTFVGVRSAPYLIAKRYFNMYFRNADQELCSNCKKLFDILDPLFDNNKKKAVVWPLQTLLLTLCPDVLGEISGSDPPSDHNNFRKVIFCRIE